MSNFMDMHCAILYLDRKSLNLGGTIHAQEANKPYYNVNDYD